MDKNFTPSYDMIKTKRYLMVQCASDDEKKNGIIHCGVFLKYIPMDNSWSCENLDFDSAGFDYFVSNIDVPIFHEK
jgi:hypothetical protein